MASLPYNYFDTGLFFHYTHSYKRIYSKPMSLHGDHSVH